MDNTLNLQEEIDSKIKGIKITSLDISFNEIADMYKNDELIIKPDYQRMFRWDPEKQSRFIESLLLEMPIPPIYVVEVDNGVYELIDGLQRISTYLCFRGMLKTKDLEYINEENAQLCYDEEEDDSNDGGINSSENNGFSNQIAHNSVAENNFKLHGCDIAPELNDYSFNDLSTSLQIRAKRCFITLKVLRKGTDPALKYHMFKRLNTGGEKLTPQEIRNCSIRLIDSRFLDFIIKLSHNSDFQKTISYIGQRRKDKKEDEELVLRFFALKNSFDSFSHDVNEFMTAYMENVALSDEKNEPIFDYEKEENIFNNTFSILNQALGEKIFSPLKKGRDSLSGFSVYQYEAITYGIQSILEQLETGKVTVETLRSKLIEVKGEEDFKFVTTGGGKNSPGYLKRRCEYVRNKFEEV